MLTRNELIFKWTLYAVASALCAVVQGLFLRHIRIAGVIPFIFPLLSVIPATFEAPAAACTFSLCAGVCCDWLLPGSFPCFCALTFPLAGLLASLIAKGLLPAGMLCSLWVSAIAYLFHGGFHCVLLWAGGHAAWEAGTRTALWEFALSLPWCVPMTVLFRWVRDHTHLED